MGFFVPEEQPVIWRGPMLHKAVQQFLGDVYWGELDFLLADLPPGTGDVSISMAGFLPGRADARGHHPAGGRPQGGRARRQDGRADPPRGLSASSRTCRTSCARTAASATSIFGEGGGQEAADTLGVPLLGQIPLLPDAPRGRRRRHADRRLRPRLGRGRALSKPGATWPPATRTRSASRSGSPSRAASRAARSASTAPREQQHVQLAVLVLAERTRPTCSFVESTFLPTTLPLRCIERGHDSGAVVGEHVGAVEAGMALPRYT